MAGHGIGFCDIVHQAEPTEESNKDVEGPLEILQILPSKAAVININHTHNPSHRNPETVMNVGFILHCKLDPESNHDVSMSLSLVLVTVPR